MNTKPYNRPLHWLAVITAVATFPLIFMGGLVTSHSAGMSVPDWPNSWGYNMFLFPPRLWIGGILYEHTHRLMATVVGMLAIALTIYAWRAEIANLIGRLVQIFTRRRYGRWQIKQRHARRIQWLCLAVLAAVIFQGVLGGLRVVLVKLNLAIVHACVAQAFFCLAAFTALATSRWWESLQREESNNRVAPGLVYTCLAAVTIIYLQLIAGATMRHYDAGLAVPDFPLAYGQILPATDSAAIHQINQKRIWKLDLPTVTATQVRLNLAHRFGAALVTLSILAVSGIILLKHRDRRSLLFPAILLPIMLAGQITLGAYTVLLRKPADIASLHVAVGALTLVTMFILTSMTIRIFGFRRVGTAHLFEHGGQCPPYGELATA